MEQYIFHKDLEIKKGKNKSALSNLYACHMQRVKAKKKKKSRGALPQGALIFHLKTKTKKTHTRKKVFQIPPCAIGTF